MDFSFILEKEKKFLRDFFKRDFFIPLPEISKKNFEKFSKLGFEIHFLPTLKLGENDNFPGWLEKPSKIFYQLIKKEKLSKDSDRLFGQWIFIEKRGKPKKRVYWISKDDIGVRVLKKFKFDFKKYCQKIKKQQYENDFLTPILQENRFASRFSISWQEINEIIKPRIARFLGVSQEKIRLPRFIEWNFLGNLSYPEWGETETWEWFSDRLVSGEYLSGGNNSLGICGWDPPDYWSTILGFRILLEI